MKTLTWKKASDYAVISACAGYSVAKCGPGPDFLFMAWRTPAHAQGRKVLHVSITPAAAKAVCQEDADAAAM